VSCRVVSCRVVSCRVVSCRVVFVCSCVPCVDVCMCLVRRAWLSFSCLLCFATLHSHVAAASSLTLPVPSSPACACHHLSSHHTTTPRQHTHSVCPLCHILDGDAPLLLTMSHVLLLPSAPMLPTELWGERHYVNGSAWLPHAELAMPDDGGGDGSTVALVDVTPLSSTLVTQLHGDAVGTSSGATATATATTAQETQTVPVLSALRLGGSSSGDVASSSGGGAGADDLTGDGAGVLVVVGGTLSVVRCSIAPGLRLAMLPSGLALRVDGDGDGDGDDTAPHTSSTSPLALAATVRWPPTVVAPPIATGARLVLQDTVVRKPGLVQTALHAQITAPTVADATTGAATGAGGAAIAAAVVTTDVFHAAVRMFHCEVTPWASSQPAVEVVSGVGHFSAMHSTFVGPGQAFVATRATQVVVHVNDTVFASLSATSGAGLRVATPGASRVTLHRVTAHSNVATTSRGGFIAFAAPAGVLTVHNSSLTRNLAQAAGGGAVAITRGHLVMSHVSCTHNEGFGGGGCLLVVESSAVMDRCAVDHNVDTLGAGVFVLRGAGLTVLRDVVLTHNVAFNGGNLHVRQSEVVLERCYVGDTQGYVAPHFRFVPPHISLPPLHFTSLSHYLLFTCHIHLRMHLHPHSRPISTLHHRGVVRLVVWLPTISSHLISSRLISSHLLSSVSSLLFFFFFGKTIALLARRYEAACLKVYDDSSLNATNTTFQACEATQAGGALGVYSRSHAVLQSCQFLRNTAGLAGAAIHARTAAVRVSVCDTLIADNTATGAVVFLDGGAAVELRRVVVANNTIAHDPARSVAYNHPVVAASPSGIMCSHAHLHADATTVVRHNAPFNVGCSGCTITGTHALLSALDCSAQSHPMTVASMSTSVLPTEGGPVVVAFTPALTGASSLGSVGTAGMARMVVAYVRGERVANATLLSDAAAMVTVPPGVGVGSTLQVFVEGQTTLLSALEVRVVCACGLAVLRSCVRVGCACVCACVRVCVRVVRVCCCCSCVSVGGGHHTSSFDLMLWVT